MLASALPLRLAPPPTSAGPSSSGEREGAAHASTSGRAALASRSSAPRGRRGGAPPGPSLIRGLRSASSHVVRAAQQQQQQQQADPGGGASTSGTGGTDDPASGPPPPPVSFPQAALALPLAAFLWLLRDSAAHVHRILPPEAPGLAVKAVGAALMASAELREAAILVAVVLLIRGCADPFLRAIHKLVRSKGDACARPLPLLLPLLFPRSLAPFRIPHASAPPSRRLPRVSPGPWEKSPAAWLLRDVWVPLEVLLVVFAACRGLEALWPPLGLPPALLARITGPVVSLGPVVTAHRVFQL